MGKSWLVVTGLSYVIIDKLEDKLVDGFRMVQLNGLNQLVLIFIALRESKQKKRDLRQSIYVNGVQ